MSAFANVYLGAAPNDLTGDTLRNAFQIINQNFANIASGNANVVINAPVNSVAGRTGNVLLYVNDVYGAASNAWVNAQTTAANTYANVLYATTTSNITNNVYAQISANLSSNIASIANDLVVSGNVLAPVNANLAQTNANVAAANIRIQTISANLGGVNLSVTDLVAANVVFNANLGTATTDIIALQSNAAAQATALNTLLANAVTQNSQIQTLNANLGTATTNIATLLANAATQSSALAGLEANAAAQSLSLAVLTVNAAAQADTLGVLTANTVAQQVAIAALQANSAIQGAELVAYAANSATQGSQINAINANLGTATTNIANLQTDVIDLQDNLAPVGALQANDAVQATQIRTLDANLGTATTNIATNFTETNNLRANITAANAAIVTANSSMRFYVDSQDSAISSAWTANAVIQAVQINTINANLGTATTNITTLFANAAEQHANIDFLISNVTTTAVFSTQFRAFSNANAVSQAQAITALQANLGAYQIYANGQIGTLNTINANIGAFQIYANSLPTANAAAITGNLIPITSNAYSLGREGLKWDQIWAGGNINPTFYLQAGEGLQTPLVSTGNLNSNTALIYDQAIVGNIRTVDIAGTANLANIITTLGVFWANGENYANSFASYSNLKFVDTTISTAIGAGSGIILNSAGAGEIAMLDYVGVNNTNPGYWLHIGDGAPGAVENTGNISIDYNNGNDARRGSTIMGYAWWDASANGNDNRGTGVHTHFGIYKNDDTFDNKFIEFNYVTGNANVGNLTATSLTVLTNVSYTMANYQNWTSNVSTIGAALDQLAARLKNAGF